ncbi:zinc ribbon domain-containing protein [Thermodesulfatator atlanticus]|uniref:zinc ribbon domain-containing protein n=1 Tax=Thermodesulfatator atlanticus TaxID=501497 RepID=UPI0003B608AD|nr:zinc ribbon domain-containing protein [Thermodesulfatator atlanticus]
MNCPACNGNIPEGAFFCPYCGYDVRGSKRKFWFMAGLAGAFAGAALVLVYQLIKERELWLSHKVNNSSSCIGEDSDEDIMDF